MLYNALIENNGISGINDCNLSTPDLVLSIAFFFICIALLTLNEIWLIEFGLQIISTLLVLKELLSARKYRTTFKRL